MSRPSSVHAHPVNFGVSAATSCLPPGGNLTAFPRLAVYPPPLRVQARRACPSLKSTAHMKPVSSMLSTHLVLGSNRRQRHALHCTQVCGRRRIHNLAHRGGGIKFGVCDVGGAGHRLWAPGSWCGSSGATRQHPWQGGSRGLQAAGNCTRSAKRGRRSAAEGSMLTCTVQSLEGAPPATV